MPWKPMPRSMTIPATSTTTKDSVERTKLGQALGEERPFVESPSRSMRPARRSMARVTLRRTAQTKAAARRAPATAGSMAVNV